MNDNEVRISNREIYDSLQELKSLVAGNVIRTDMRLDAVENELTAKRAQSWQMKLALWGSLVGVVLGLPMAIIGLVN